MASHWVGLPQARRIRLSECVALCLPSPGAVTWFVTLLGIVFSAIAPDRIGRTIIALERTPVPALPWTVLGLGDSERPGRRETLPSA
jgi:hypothetical protein